MAQAVELRGVTKRFGKHVAVDDLDLTVPEGSVYGFIGPNGSGKTTTLRMILRILYPDDGEVVVLDEGQGHVADDRVGYLPEERGLYKKMKVFDVLRFYARLKGFNNCASEIDQWLERLELSDWKYRKVETLSKGMSQKVQFIATIVSKPRLVILDEPFSGLDPVNLEVLKDAMLSLRKSGATIIFSTHDMEAAERMCDTIFMIFQGRKVLDGPLSDIQRQYGSDTLRVRLAAGHESLAGINGVLRVNDFGRMKELRIDQQTDTQDVLRQLMTRGTVEQFELTSPTLHDIFVRIAGADSIDEEAMQ